jgi:Fe-S-cluster containining protein
MKCRPGCSACCVDDLTVFGVEAENIRIHNADLLANALPHEYGGCAFLNEEGRCRIYNHRPYVCRTQGLPLYWTDEDSSGTLLVMRDICPENEAGMPVEQLPEALCWEIGPVEEKLALMQYKLGNGARTREKLRDLFRQQPASAVTGR